MNSLKTLTRLEKIHQLITQECTGTPKELALRLQFSVRTIHHLLELLKEYDAEIKYDRSRKTYYYTEEFTFEVNVSLSINGDNNIISLLNRYSA